MTLKALIKNKVEKNKEEDIVNDIIIDIISVEDFQSLSFIQKQAIAKLRNCGGIANEEMMKDFNDRTLNSLIKKEIIRKTQSGHEIMFHLIEMTADKEEDSNPLTMNTNEFRDTCEKVLGGWGWQGRLASAIGVHKNTVAKWAAGRLEVPVYVTALIESLEVIKSSGGELPERFQK